MLDAACYDRTMNEGTKREVTRQRFLRLPRPPDLWEAPEPSTLAALHVCLELADVALLAAYPQLCDLGAAYAGDAPPLDLCVARIISRRAEKLRDAIIIYRKVRRQRWSLPRANEEVDIPF